MIFKLLQYGFQASLSYRKIGSYINIMSKICCTKFVVKLIASELKHVYCYPNLWFVTYAFEYNCLGPGGGG